MSAVRLSKRKTLPHGINEWPEEVIQEKLLAAVTHVNVDVEVILQTLLPKANISLTQTAVAYMEYLPEGINSVISLQSLDQGKRWLEILWQDFVIILNEKVAAVVTFGASVHRAMERSSPC